MKKIFLLLVSFLFILNVKGSDSLTEFDITYVDNALTKAIRSYTDNRYIFDMEYIGDITNLTSEQLDFALNQESSDYLTVYGTLSVKTNYRNINDIYVGISSGTFGNNINDEVMPNDVASKKNKNFEIKQPIMEVFYRLDENSGWINDRGNLNGSKTIKEQLSELLNIDLDSVKDNYKKLYYFKPYENMTYSNRIDIYDKTDSTSLENNNNEYDVSTLKKINTEYGILRFKEVTESTFFETTNNKNVFSYILLITLTICLITFYYLKSKKLI